MLKKKIPVIAVIATLAVSAFLMVGCFNLSNIIPDTVTENWGQASWTINGAGSHTRTRSFTLSEADLARVNASVMAAGGTASLRLTQGALTRTTNLIQSGITNADVQINTQDLTAGVPIEFRITLNNVIGFSVDISWR